MLKEQVCRWCGLTFYAERTRKWCSQTCALSAYRGRRYPNRTPLGSKGRGGPRNTPPVPMVPPRSHVVRKRS